MQTSNPNRTRDQSIYILKQRQIFTRNGNLDHMHLNCIDANLHMYEKVSWNGKGRSIDSNSTQKRIKNYSSIRSVILIDFLIAKNISYTNLWINIDSYFITFSFWTLTSGFLYTLSPFSNCIKPFATDSSPTFFSPITTSYLPLFALWYKAMSRQKWWQR